MQWLKFLIIISVGIGILAVTLGNLDLIPLQYISSVIPVPHLKVLTTEIQNLLNKVGLNIGPLLQNQNIKSKEDGSTKKEEKVKPTDDPLDKKERLFTVEELREYDGKKKKGLCLAILGLVFNVKRGKQYYGPGGGYEFFTGLDGSRAFVIGEFNEEGLIDDVTGLEPSDYIGLDEWVAFYRKDYRYMGKLIGRYYDENGEPTPYNLEVQKWISKAYQEKDDDDQSKQIFPPCNSEWSAETGSRVWCTAQSGGITRDWVGVPRKLFTRGSRRARCACIKNSGPPSHDLERKAHQDRGDLDNPNLEEYKGCDPQQPFCHVIDN